MAGKLKREVIVPPPRAPMPRPRVSLQRMPRDRRDRGANLVIAVTCIGWVVLVVIGWLA